MPVVSRTTTFLVWQFYRSRVVPACVLIALLSILFGGALVLEDSLSQEHPDLARTTGALNQVVVTNLLAASLLMLCHATYLTLMANHLVYRFPIEQRKWISLAYIAIVFGYVAHGRHTYLEATGQHGLLEAAWWSSAAFAVAYIAMAAHGAYEYRAERGAASHERQRPTQRVRGGWMLWTDLAISLVVTIMFASAAGIFSVNSPLSLAAIPPIAQVLRQAPLAAALYSQASPKDTLIALALLGYLLARCIAQHRLRKGQAERQANILSIQTIDPSGIDWTPIRSGLPSNAAWLDLAGGAGRNVRDLIELLYVNHPELPGEITFLDKDAQALNAASSAWKQASFNSIKQTYLNSDMCSTRSRETLERCQVVHMGHAAYQPAVANSAVQLLVYAKAGTCLLLRFTSDASLYRVVSSSAACAVLRPYIHHYTHQLFIEDLCSQGWYMRVNLIVPRWCDIGTQKNREYVIDWCDAQYGEFSGDVLERYLDGFAKDEQTHVLNSDRLILFVKGKEPIPTPVTSASDRDVANSSK